MKKTISLLSMLMLSCPLFAATDPLLTPSMVTLKGGEFVMGGTANPKNDDYPASEPLHTVNIKNYRLSRYATTVGQFRQFIEATGYKADGDCWKLAANDWGMDSGTPWSTGCALFHGSSMVIHRGGNYSSGPAGASPTYRAHAGTDNRRAK